MAIQLTEGSHWRDSARPAKFFFIDARASFPVILFLVHIRLWTFIVAMIMMLFFTVLNHFGYGVGVFFRIFKCVLSGSRKMAIPWWVN
jgi:intracellular multiplication protein IcmT